MDVANTLEMAELDLDDDIIVGINNGSHVDLFEIYKIAERTGPIEYNNVGSWSDTDGFVMTTAPKYYRRGDLMVSSLIIRYHLRIFQQLPHQMAAYLSGK